MSVGKIKIEYQWGKTQLTQTTTNSRENGGRAQILEANQRRTASMGQTMVTKHGEGKMSTLIHFEDLRYKKQNFRRAGVKKTELWGDPLKGLTLPPSLPQE